MSLCKLVTQSGGSAQSTGYSLVANMEGKEELQVVVQGVKEENISEGESHNVGEIKIKQEAQEDTWEVTPGPRPLLLPVLDIKPERDWKPDVRAATMETMDVLRHPALPGRSDLSQNNITYDLSITRPELLEICKKNMEMERHEIDNIAGTRGFEAAALPL